MLSTDIVFIHSFIDRARRYFVFSPLPASFKYDSQNSLRQHDFELILDFYENLIREKTGRIPDETIHCILEMYCQSSIYMTVKWVLGELECAPEGLAKILVDGMPGKLSELFEKLEILS